MSLNLFRPTLIKRFFFFFVADFILSAITFYISYDLRFNFDIPPVFLENIVPLFLVLITFKVLALYIFNIYSIPWRYFSLDSLEKIVKAHISAYALFFAIYSLAGEYLEPFPRSVVIIDLFLSMIFLGSLRISKRFLLETKNKTGSSVIIIGTDKNAEIVARYLGDKNSEFFPVAFIEDDQNAIGSTIFNIKVVGFENLEGIVSEYSVESAIIAKEYEPEKLNEIFEHLKSLGVENIKLVGIFQNSKEKIKELSIEDLLARNPKDLDKDAILHFVKDKNILITGAGGSIGSELVNQCITYGANSLVLVDNSEFNLYKLTTKYETYRNIKFVLGNVTDYNYLQKVFQENKPDIVLHAAACKHVPLVEENIKYACENNILGTQVVIDLSIEYEVDTFVLISTDKAVRPTNVMGTTKRVCELYAQNVSSNRTKIVSVRFGNVLGSSGSVVPRFAEQIEGENPITVTHPEVTRYFMLISEACELVLQAASLGEGGEVFILDMGKPVKIVDLAKKMLQIYNKEHLEIKFTGLRPGEKLYEELLIDENDKKTKYESILIAPRTDYDIKKLNEEILKLLTGDNQLDVLKRVVTEFEHKK